MITAKKFLITSLFILLTQSYLSAQHKLFTFGIEKYYPFDTTSTRANVPNELNNKSFKHRLVLPIITNDTLVITHSGDTICLIQSLDSAVLRDKILQGPIHLRSAKNEKVFAILKRIKIIAIEESQIEFKGLLKVKGVRKEWIRFVIPVSDLSGIFIGNSSYAIPFVATGTIVVGVIAVGIMAYLDDDDFE